MLRAYAVKASVARRVAHGVASVSRVEPVQRPGRAERPAAADRPDPDAAAHGDRRAEPNLDIQQNPGRVFRAQADARPAAGRAPGAPGPAARPGRRAARQEGLRHGDGEAPASGALAQLRDAEQTAVGVLLSHLGGASPSLAQLYASIATSEATHVTMLATRISPTSQAAQNRPDS